MIKAVGLFLFMVLKILGWLLLTLFILLIAMLLFVLFVPVRYRIMIQNERDAASGNSLVKNIQAQAKVSWLLHFIHINLNYGPKGFTNEIRAAGLDVRKVLAGFNKRREKKQNRNRAAKEEPDSGRRTDTTQSMSEQTIDPLEPDAKNQTINTAELEENERSVSLNENISQSKALAEEAKDENVSQSKALAEEAKDETEILESKIIDSEKNKTSKDHKKRRKKKNILSELYSGIQKKLYAIKNAITGIRTKLSIIREKIHMLYGEITSPGNRNAVSHLWKELCYLVLKYKPRKVSAELAFSLADPALTGEVLGMISMFPHVYRSPYHITADFESDKLYVEGELELQGKVTGYVMVMIFIRLIRDKDCMAVFRRIMGKS